jgi:IclR family pca regulon transcriptional regulator
VSDDKATRLIPLAKRKRDPANADSAPIDESDGSFVQSLSRGLAVIRAFNADRPRMTLSEVAEITGLSRAVVRRYLLTLEKLHYVAFDGRRFSLRPRVLELGYSYLSSLSLAEIARPRIETLVERFNESSSISVLDGTEIVYVVRVPARRIMSVAIAIGTHFPAYATSMGRVLLASLDDIALADFFEQVELTPFSKYTITSEVAIRQELNSVRHQGWAAVDQELEEGLRSVAVPIRGSRGEVIAAMNMSVHVNRATIEELVRDFVPELQVVAAEITRDLAARA